MKIKPRSIPIIILTILAIALSSDLSTTPTPQPHESPHFSSHRVAQDLEHIGREPHSLRAPEARARVREYLVQTLEEMGLSPQVTEYPHADTTFRDTITLSNIRLTIDPPSGTATSYMTFVAHYDAANKYSHRTKEIEPSCGAADDGYGVGVTLELLRVALSRHSEWKQGIKVLFTDGEEFGMLGMKCAWNQDRPFFDHTGLLINIEARGVQGPALLFETSQGNEQIIELYRSAARYPAAYSLSSTVYNILPNYTDFTIAKDSLCGVNFSVIDNLYYYHTREDNPSNISQHSIQHYGEQIAPMMTRFLTEDRYADPRFFRSETDNIYFSIPVLGLIVISKPIYLVINIIALLLSACAALIMRKRVNKKTILKNSGLILTVLIGSAIVGTALAYAWGVIYDVKFQLISMVCSKYDLQIGITYFVLIALALYAILTQRRSHLSAFHLSAVVFNSVLILVTMLLFPDNFVIMIPTMISAIMLIIRELMPEHHNTCRIVSAIGFFAILITTLPLINLLITGLGIGALGVVSIVVLLVAAVAIPLAISSDDPRQQ